MKMTKYLNTNNFLRRKNQKRVGLCGKKEEQKIKFNNAKLFKSHIGLVLGLRGAYSLNRRWGGGLATKSQVRPYGRWLDDDS